MRTLAIQNISKPFTQPLSVRYCERFLCKLRGLMFQRSLQPAQGLLFAYPKPSRLNAGIHMLGMVIDLSIIWLDGEKKVVDKGFARRWVSFIIPKKPARYVIECAVSRYEDFAIGNQIAFEESA